MSIKDHMAIVEKICTYKSINLILIMYNIALTIKLKFQAVNKF